MRADQATNWPTLSTEERPWDISPVEGHLDAFQRHRLSRPYRAAVVPEVSSATYAPSSATAELEDEASRAIVRFDAEMAALPTPMPAILLRTESSSSSRIENLTAGARAVAVAEMGHGTSRNALLVAASTRAMRAALEDFTEVTTRTLLAAHRLLLEHDDPEIAGTIRTSQVWIGASSLSPHGADFVPPHHERVPALLDDLTTFAARRDIAPLAHSALVHAQLETIHPFVDGNGRTGRAVVHTMLRARGLARSTPVPVSAGLLRDTDGYFRALDSYRAGDCTPIVDVFAHAAFSATTNGRTLAADVAEIRSGWEETLKARKDSTAWRLLDLVITHPVVDAAHVAASLTVSDRGARNAIGALEDAGILSGFSVGRVRLWQAPSVLAAMDDFARRAGRRSV